MGTMTLIWTICLIKMKGRFFTEFFIHLSLHVIISFVHIFISVPKSLVLKVVSWLMNKDYV